ncbi:hypothetical protein MMC26_002779 [Xylographa opegraphella]|nr:hypothetical protein [Xylographa opegraphella]
MAPLTLMELPVELKLQIMKHLLVVDKPIYLKPPFINTPVSATFPGGNSGLHPAIIVASKTFATDGANMLYGDNHFHFKTLRILKAFSSSIDFYSRFRPFNNRHRIKHISVAISLEMLEYIMSDFLLPHFQNLKILGFNCWYFDEGQSSEKDACVQYWRRRMEEEVRQRMNVEWEVVRIEP